MATKRKPKTKDELITEALPFVEAQEREAISKAMDTFAKNQNTLFINWCKESNTLPVDRDAWSKFIVGMEEKEEEESAGH